MTWIENLKAGDWVGFRDSNQIIIIKELDIKSEHGTFVSYTMDDSSDMNVYDINVEHLEKEGYKMTAKQQWLQSLTPQQKEWIKELNNNA